MFKYPCHEIIHEGIEPAEDLTAKTKKRIRFHRYIFRIYRGHWHREVAKSLTTSSSISINIIATYSFACTISWHRPFNVGKVHKTMQAIV